VKVSQKQTILAFV